MSTRCLLFIDPSIIFNQFQFLIKEISNIKEVFISTAKGYYLHILQMDVENSHVIGVRDAKMCNMLNLYSYIRMRSKFCKPDFQSRL